jgi:hypothetical protein
MGRAGKVNALRSGHMAKLACAVSRQGRDARIVSDSSRRRPKLLGSDPCRSRRDSKSRGLTPAVRDVTPEPGHGLIRVGPPTDPESQRRTSGRRTPSPCLRCGHAVIVPTNVFYQLSFHEGSRHPLERGAAGIALLASMPPRPGERDLVPLARQQGWVITHGEVEPNTYGLAVPVRRRPPSPPTCINLISHREDVVVGGRDAVIKAADELSMILS